MQHISRYIRLSIFFLFLLSLFTSNSDCLAGAAKIHWNDRAINWQGYDEGLAQAKQMRKPAIIVFYADWCPTCKKYGLVFKNSKVIQEASDFIMIRVNKDKHARLSTAYGFDGEYVPRTFAVDPDGEVMHQIYPPKKYKYYIGVNPNNLLSLMQRARSRIE